MNLFVFAQQISLFLPKVKTSVWIYGENFEDFDTLRKPISAFQNYFPRQRWVFTTLDSSSVALLKKRYIDDFVFLTPLPKNIILSRFFQSTNPSALIILRSYRGLSKKVILLTLKNNIPIIWLEIDKTSFLEIKNLFSQHIVKNSTNIFCSKDKEVIYELCKLGFTKESVLIDNNLWGEVSTEKNFLKVTNQINSLLESHLLKVKQLDKSSVLMPTFRDKIGQSYIWKKIANIYSKYRIDTLEILKQKLNYPKTILCLGNGPSSENPELFDLKYDVLFRVNYVWQERKLFDKPDVVFVGDPTTIKKVKNCIFGISTLRKEYGILLRKLWTDGIKPIKFFTLERLLNFCNDTEHNDKLSTGVLMLMIAVALQPKRLIVSGIDLYKHSQGRYPGDLYANNKYAPNHNIDSELEAISQILSQYENELIIIGDILRKSLVELGINCR